MPVVTVVQAEAFVEIWTEKALAMPVTPMNHRI
jgi:hypothetical protein